MSRAQQRVRGQVEESSPNGRRMVVLGGVLAALVLGVVAIALLGRDSGGAVQPEAYAGVPVEGRLLGEPDAPVTIRDFSDFKCPHCRDAATVLMPEVIAEYVRAGQVRVEFVPVAVVHQESTLAAQAALCAEEQGGFWAYHDLLFARQQGNSFNQQFLIGLADDAGLDEQRLRDCLLSGKFISQVEANNTEFRNVGGPNPGTPTFLVNGERVEGAVPFEQMQAAIEAQLNP